MASFSNPRARSPRWLLPCAIGLLTAILIAGAGCEPPGGDAPEVVEARRWIIELRGGEPAARAQAARRLGAIDRPEVVAALTEALSDPRTDVRLAAVEALGQRGGARAERALVTALEDAAIPVRLAAMDALAGLGATVAVEPLVARLADERSELRWGAIEALAGIGDAAIEPLMGAFAEAASPKRAAVITALGRLGDENAIPLILKAAEEDEPAMRLAAAAALGEIGTDRGTPALSKLLADPLSEQARRRFERAREQVPAGEAPQLRQELIHERIRDRVPRLDRYGVDDTASLLNRLTEEKQRIEEALEPEVDNEEVRLRVIDVKGKAAWDGWDEAERQRQIDRMVDLLRDTISPPRSDTPAAKLRQVRSLAMLAESRIDRRWWAGLDESEQQRRLKARWQRQQDRQQQDLERDIRRAAINALEAIGTDAAAEAVVGEFGRHGREVDRLCETLLRGMDADVETSLAAMIRDTDRREGARQAAVDVLVARGEAGRKAVVELMREEDGELRRWAATALLDHGDEQLFDAMVELAESDDRHVRRTAVNVLGRIGDPAARSAVRRRLGDEDMAVKLEAARWIGPLGERRAISDLADLIARYKEPEGDLNGEPRRQRRQRTDLVAAAVRSLIDLNVTRARDEVLGLLEASIIEEDEVLFAVAEAVAEMQAGDAVERIAELAGGDWRRRMHVAPLLGRTGDAAAIEILREWAAPEHQVQDAAVEGLARLKHEDAVTVLIELAREDGGENVAQGRRLARALSRQGELAIGPLAEVLENDESEFMRALAAEVLAAAGSEGLEALKAASSADQERVKLSAIHGLGLVREQGLVEPARRRLEAMLEDGSERVRMAVYWALGEVGDAGSIRVIERAKTSEQAGRMRERGGKRRYAARVMHPVCIADSVGAARGSGIR